MEITSNLLLHSLLLALVLTVSACTGAPSKKIPDMPASEAPIQKKSEEPAAKKPELADKPQPPPVRMAEQELNRGIRNYEEGEYKGAASNFQNALSGGLVSVADQVTAHKFLAFIYCISKEQMACRGEFKEILALDPKFDLTPAEAGHPIWDPVFREVKAEAGKKKQKK